MKVGTKSLLFGVHQFIIHPYYVYKAWRNVYGPIDDYRILLAILIHDWGYFGMDNMDGEEGKRHPELAGNIMGMFFGNKWREFCLGHSTCYSKIMGKNISKLCIADKLAFNLEHRDFILLRSRLSGELEEYKQDNIKRINILNNIGISNMTDEQWYVNVYFYNMRMVLRLIETIPGNKTI